MLDQLAGKPSPSWRRSQVFLVLLFWISRIALTSPRGPRVLYLRRVNRFLSRFTPWQLILSTLTALYALRHGDVLLGLQAPEPLARLYSRDYYRATWIVTAFDAGFATAQQIRWKWLRDVFSLVCTAYYLLFANEADEKLRKYRAICTVEMLRTTWEKTSNPYIRFFTRKDRPRVGVRKRLFLPRPPGSKYTKPMTAYLFFNGTEQALAEASDLVLDIPGGGFICMNPQHHEERLLRWARQTGKVVLSFDYGKAPEYPFPFAIDEMYDAYLLLNATKGKCIGMNVEGNRDLRVVLTGDSAGANIATAMLVKLLEQRPSASPSKPSSSSSSSSSASTARVPPLPVSLVFAYPALSFHFTSWMPSSDLRVLRSESHPDVQTLLKHKSHLEHRSPLSVVQDLEPRAESSDRTRPVVQRRRKRTSSWGRGLVGNLPGSKSFASLRNSLGASTSSNTITSKDGGPGNGNGNDEMEEVAVTDETEKSVSERILYWNADDETDAQRQKELAEQVVKDLEEKTSGKAPGDKGDKKEQGGVLVNTRLAMTSRTAFFNDRIISPPMLRAMALLYIGPRNSPDLHSDYHISPIFTPPHLLHQFPPVYMCCGERDPLVDDTVIFAGKLREAKEARKLELVARESRHGESLRMSGGGGERDPILDEDEDDWVRTTIVEGWSHGFLQMIALLPAAEKVIGMMGDWITEAFDKDSLKKNGGARTMGDVVVPAVPRTKVSPPLTPTSAVSTATSVKTIPINPDHLHASSPVDSAAVDTDSEKDDDVLSFTPKRRRGSSNVSRTASPAPGGARAGSRAPSNATSPTRDGFASAPSSLGASSQTILSTSPTESFAGAMAGHLVTPVERAMREDSHYTSVPHSKHSPLAPATPTASSVGPRRAGTPSVTRALSDDETHLRGGSASVPPVSLEDAVKKVRAGSAGALPAPVGAHFVDAKLLLRRRRDDLVSGLSASNSRTASRNGSDHEEDATDVSVET
ncbi:hypothetical protein JCM10212_007115 [Sporobolomyces blumeae]